MDCKEIERLKNIIENLEKDNELLTSIIADYEQERKGEIFNTLNDHEKMLVCFIDELQYEQGFNDYDLITSKYGENDRIKEDFIFNFFNNINKEKIKKYYNYEKYHK